MVRNILQGDLVFFHYGLLPQPAVISLSRLIILFFFWHLLPLPLPLSPLFKILLPSSIVFSTVSSFPSYGSFLHHCQPFGWHPLSTFPFQLLFFCHILLPPSSVASSFSSFTASFCCLFLSLPLSSSTAHHPQPCSSYSPILPIPPSDMFFCYLIPLCSSSSSPCLLLFPSSFPFFCHFLPL